VSKLFTPEGLHTISRNVAGLPARQAFDGVLEQLEASVPGRIRHDHAWLFNTACGAMGQLKLLYGSLSEYLILFGTPIGTEGHSGRYHADVHDFMLTGEMWTYHEGEIEKTIYRPGDAALLTRGRTKGYRAFEDTWMLEYATGWIPTMLPTGMADNLFSNLDYRAMFRLMGQYGGMVIKELLRGKL